MARKSLKAYVKNFAVIDSETPNTHVNLVVPGPNALYRTAPGDGKWMLIQFDNLTARLGRYRLLDVSAKFALKTAATTAWIKPLLGTYNASTVTWNTKPEYYSDGSRLVGGGVSLELQDFDFTSTSTATAKSELAKNLLAYCGGIFEPTQHSYAFELYTKLTDGSTPYLEFFYDDAETVQSQIVRQSGPISGTVNTLQAIQIVWRYDPSGDYYCAQPFTQDSAVFYWKYSDEANYRTVSASGNIRSVTFPANSLKTGATVQWYVKGTDTTGRTTQTPVYSFQTNTTQITPDSYPTGNSIDTRTAKSFTWHFASDGGNFGQSSAVLYWRVQGAETWNTVAASGTTQSLSAPAYTFPAGKTIEWYLEGTDSGGYVSRSSTLTFKTLDYTLTVTTRPTGSGINPQTAIYFAWTLSNSQGAAAQKSAVLYWRVQGAETYNAIQISSANKSYTVPANTFPTGSTIQWYLSVTAADNTVKTTAAQTFTTAAPKITPVTYPSGSSVESGTALSFSWAFLSGQTQFSQASARLYWRASTSDPYQSIAASGSTTNLTIPKNTFPGNGSTIFWYLEGTDAGGYTSQSSVMSFQTTTSQITPQSSPTSGYRDPRNAITFSWYFKTPAASYDQASAVFHWRVQGSTAWTNVADSQNAGSVTIPANTFPVASTIEWYLSGTDVGGCSSESQVYSFSTAASTTYAICQAPVGIVEDGTKPITFRWTIQNTDGTTPTRTLLWWKLPTESSSQWHELLDTTTDVTSYTAAANTFPAGAIEWRVQAYNRDAVAGPISEASFVVLRAPEPPEGLSATAVPLSTISWQSDGQEAYEITIDGEIVAAEYGPSVYSWTVPEPLEDGVHSILVRIQGAYGLWSSYAETSIDVQNAPTGSLTLAGSFDVDADLSVTAEELPAASPVQWYRDGKRIGRTSAREFRDRMVLGTHSYYAEIWLDNGNYTRSNTVAGSMAVRSPMIAAEEGGEWLSLRLSKNRERTQSFEWSNTVALQHIAAADFPILEQSRFEDLTGAFDCAFKDPEEARRFEALRKKAVVLKSPRGQVIVGGFSKYTKTATAFYDSYTFSIQQIHREDFVDDTDA